MNKEKHMYFICPKIKVLLSQTSCKFNKAKASHPSIDSFQACVDCPKEFIDSRALYTEEEILNEIHRPELDEVNSHIKIQFKKAKRPKKNKPVNNWQCYPETLGFISHLLIK